MMRSKRNTTLCCLLLVGLLGLGAGCDEESSGGGGRGGRNKKKAAADAAEAGEGEGDKPERGPIVYRDEDFVESIRNRDPFVGYTETVTAEAPTEVQRPVIMPTTSVDEMRLIAIITGMPRPKAMLVDVTGVGHVVQRGDYLGRPRLIQATGSVSMTLNWRVDRIRDNEVVLTQQDPADPTRTALTKVIVLNEEVAQR